MPRPIRPVHAVPAGRAFVRAAMALALAKGDAFAASDLAKMRWPDSPGALDVIERTAVGAGTPSDSGFAQPLVRPPYAAAEFSALALNGTLLGKLTGLRRVPFNVAYPVQTADAAVAVEWLGAGKGTPLSKAALTTNTMSFAKVGGMVVVARELLERGGSDGEAIVQTLLLNAAEKMLDQQFIDPGVIAVANASPASVLNGATNVRQATGATAVTLAADLRAVVEVAAANNALGAPHWVMTKATACAIALLRDTAGAPAFPTMSYDGGTLAGIPCLVSNAVPSSVSAGTIIALVDAAQIDCAVGPFEVTVATHAAIQMDSAPGQHAATPTATTLVSMFQTNSAAIQLSCYANWQVVRAGVVGYVDNLHL